MLGQVKGTSTEKSQVGQSEFHKIWTGVSGTLTRSDQGDGTVPTATVYTNKPDRPYATDPTGTDPSHVSSGQTNTGGAFQIWESGAQSSGWEGWRSEYTARPSAYSTLLSIDIHSCNNQNISCFGMPTHQITPDRR